jgi:SAM-dependent methyltransferase
VTVNVDDLKQKVVRSLDRAGRRRFMGAHEKLAKITLGEVADVPSPKILELGCGLGGLSSKLLETHPTAQVTVTDIDPTFVAAVAAGDLGSHPRAAVREMDATAIDAPDGYYDLAVFALSLHQLSPELAARVFAEGTLGSEQVVSHRPPPAAGAAPLGGVGRGAAAHWAGSADTRWVHQLATRL